MNDPRFSRPSASAFPRLAACPASHRLSLEARAQGMAPGDSKDSRHGDAVHEEMRDGNQASDIAQRMEAQETSILEEWEAGTKSPVGNFREHRLYMLRSGKVTPDPESDIREILFSGQSDSIWLNHKEDKGLIIDFKSLPGEVEHATGNLQLMALAVLAAGRWNLKSVRVAIVQPLAGPPTVADYDEPALRKAREYIRHIVALADGDNEHPRMGDPGPEPNPGSHCRHCDARVICPALNKACEVKELELIQEHSHLAPPDLLASALNALPAIKGYIEAVESVARARLERGEEIPGYCLKERKGKREIGDVHSAYQNLPLAPLEFIKCCSASIPKIEDQLVATGVAKRGKVKEYLQEVLGDNLTQKTSLVLAKAGKELAE